MLRILIALLVSLPLISHLRRRSRSKPVEHIYVVVRDCSGDLDFSISSWRARVKAASQLTWHVSGVPSYRIEPKDPDTWPFTPPAPPGGTPYRPVRTTIPNLPMGTSASYNIILECPGGDVPIDPDIIISYV